jgi:molybdate transport system ATP-binding protein
MAENRVLVDLNGATVRRNGQRILDNVSVQIRLDECWAVVGPMGSGKTSLLQVLAGQLSMSAGTLVRHSAATFVSFKEESRQFSYGHYFYQQRYQATMSDAGPSLRTYLNYAELLADEVLIQQLGLASLLDSSFLKLSNGQTRKARIAKALLQRPALLLLDNPFVGLDAASRADLATWLNALIKRDTTLVMVTESDDIPAFVTHVLSLEGACWVGPKEHYTVPANIHSSPPVPTLQTPSEPLNATDVFQLNNVTVRYGERLLLNELTWIVRVGEKWALLGPNGVGKSVLLSLLYGDHPQAYANDVRVFGHRRGKSGESIWTVKRRIGFVSPELHLYFPQHLTVRQVILTGLTDTLTVPKTIFPVTENDLNALTLYFGVTALLSRSFGTLSTGEQRLILLIRALIKNPPVLLLDEPFQAFDSHHIQLARRLLDTLPKKSLLFVTHNQRELPKSVDQLFELSRIDPK